jgi:hypothetical protein
MTKHRTTLYINSGICKCGHFWDEHHLGMICNKNAWDTITSYLDANHPNLKVKDSTGREYRYPMYMPGECEHFGFNEYGGMKPIMTTLPDDPDDDHNEEWEDHCHGYEDKDGPLGEVEWES